MFAQRENGKIVGLFELPQPGYAEEEIAEDHPDVLEFLALPVPASVTRRQLLIALARMEIISGEEALAAAKTGAVPTAVQTVFDNMQPADKLAAEITWASMSVAERANPLVAALAQANDMTDVEIDDFFRLAASI